MHGKKTKLVTLKLESFLAPTSDGVECNVVVVLPSWCSSVPKKGGKEKDKKIRVYHDRKREKCLCKEAEIY